MIFIIILIAMVLEIATWVLVAQVISGWYVFFWFIIAGMIGIKMMTSSIAILKPSLQQIQIFSGNFEGEISKRLVWSVAGFLLTIPGLISDFFALIILLPITQKRVKKFAVSLLAKRQEKIMNDMFGQMRNMSGTGNPFAEMMQKIQRQNQRDNTIIDVEAQEIHSEQKRIAHKK